LNAKQEPVLYGVLVLQPEFVVPLGPTSAVTVVPLPSSAFHHKIPGVGAGIGVGVGLGVGVGVGVGVLLVICTIFATEGTPLEFRMNSM
jgi:hypothetical protein